MCPVSFNGRDPELRRVCEGSRGCVQEEVSWEGGGSMVWRELEVSSGRKEGKATAPHTAVPSGKHVSEMDLQMSLKQLLGAA